MKLALVGPASAEVEQSEVDWRAEQTVGVAGLMSDSDEEEGPAAEANGAADAKQDEAPGEADEPAAGPSGSSHRGRLKRLRDPGKPSNHSTTTGADFA